MNSKISFLVINLDRSQDRWDTIQKLASDEGISIERVPAVDGNAIPQSEWKDFNLRKFHLFHGRRPKGAEYGCYMSHIRALEIVVERNLPYAVILEDDAGFLPNMMARLNAIIDTGINFTAVKLFNHRTMGFIAKQTTDAGDEIGRCIHGPLGSAMGYLVTRDGASQLLKALKPMFLPYDIALERGWHGRYKIYLTRKPLIGPAVATQSTIGNYKATKFPWIMRIPTALFRGQDYIARLLYAFQR